MGLTDPVGPIRIGTADGLADVVRLTNTSAWIAGQGQIGDAMMKLVNFDNIEARGGTLVLDTGTNRIVNDSGFLFAGSDSTLEVNSDINNFGEITAFGDPGHASGTINLNGAVKNFGIIAANEGGSVNVTGALKNYELITVSGSFSASGPVLNDANGIQSVRKWRDRHHRQCRQQGRDRGSRRLDHLAARHRQQRLRRRSSPKMVAHSS